jgi:hypothetical protein
MRLSEACSFYAKVETMNSLDSRWKTRLAGAAFAALVLASSAASARPPVPSDAEAQQAHAKGACGQLGPGTGLRDGKGWVVSMMPGKHEFRVRGGGHVYLTTARVKSTLDFDIGRLYYIAVEDAPPNAVLEWRILGSEWGPVSKYFLYPPTS